MTAVIRPAAVADTGRDRDRRPATDPPSTELGVRYVGHATVLLEVPGLRILTDPFLRERLGPLRRHGPVPEPAGLGRIDVVVVSHAHPDHFDRWSLGQLRGDPLVIAPRGLGRAISRAGLRGREVVVGESVSVAPRWRVTAVAARHWRWPAAPRASTVGYLIEGPGPIGIYFAGDTGRFSAMRALRGRVDLALLPVGSWGPHLTPGHLSPGDAARVARDIEARAVVPIHWGTLFPVGLDRLAGRRRTEPAGRFVDRLARLAPGVEAHRLEPGDGTTIRL